MGGQTAIEVDFARVLSHKLPLFLGIVVALSALLLLVVFRSLLIPLQAALMNLLSIAAALGVVQAIFERGWLGGPLGIQPGPIDAFIPVIVFAIVFGLSMDYEVFLVSRIREEWQHHGDASAAVREGLARTGRVITAAAAVMITVFASFAAGDERVLKLFGIALATAVFLDAIVIRTVLLPAVLELLGHRTWAPPAGSTADCRGSRSNEPQRPSRRRYSRRPPDDGERSPTPAAPTDPALPGVRRTTRGEETRRSCGRDQSSSPLRWTHATTSVTKTKRTKVEALAACTPAPPMPTREIELSAGTIEYKDSGGKRRHAPRQRHRRRPRPAALRRRPRRPDVLVSCKAFDNDGRADRQAPTRPVRAPHATNAVPRICLLTPASSSSTARPTS